jgi:hypothetical protein
MIPSNKEGSMGTSDKNKGSKGSDNKIKKVTGINTN